MLGLKFADEVIYSWSCLKEEMFASILNFSEMAFVLGLGYLWTNPRC